MIIVWCRPVYLQRINRVCFPEPEEALAAAQNIFTQDPWPALPESFLLKGSSAFCFPPLLCGQHLLSFTPAAVSPNTEILWISLSTACTTRVTCTEGGRAGRSCRCAGHATQGDQNFHTFSFSTKTLWTWTNWVSGTTLWPCPSILGTGMTAALDVCTLAGCPLQIPSRKLSDKCHLIVQINSFFCYIHMYRGLLSLNVCILLCSWWTGSIAKSWKCKCCQ